MGATPDLGRWTGVLKGVSDPGAAKALDRAWQAAETHDIKGMEAADSAVEDGLEPVTRAAAWEELTQRLWQSSLSPVRMAGESHNLRIGYEGGQYVLLLCSDCAALGKTLAWLTSQPTITGSKDALQPVVALEKALEPKLGIHVPPGSTDRLIAK